MTIVTGGRQPLRDRSSPLSVSPPRDRPFPPPRARRARLPRTRVRAGRESSLHGRLVLVVEDDADARIIFSAMLEHQGARVVTACNGLEAVGLLLSIRPDVILCDLRMPLMDGFELARRLRADPKWLHVPLVALTALGTDADYLRTLESGFDAHITKPVDDETLFAVIERVTYHRRSA